eukprot:c18233_g1_i4.p1 GENE.c18233_g1_i4~~c18233_g1_i4.p1  ORF type:complete len:249 (+),score=32.46 c18233_g1_i4:78-824(+)
MNTRKRKTPEPVPSVTPEQQSDSAFPITSAAAFRRVLQAQKKEIYKDPPAVPPTAEILPTRQPEPKRNKRDQLVFPDHPDFLPNLTPKQVLQSGSFGGTYFRPIVSAVTGVSYKNVHEEFPTDWFEGLDLKTQVCSATYHKAVNKFGVKCGGSLGMWESSGWISALDPYGWFQWYCRFYLGRRSTDDSRQIKRWAVGVGPKGRWRVRLMNGIIKAGTHVDDQRISPVIRQVCLPQVIIARITQHPFLV